MILFARNVRSAGQVRDDVRELQAIRRPAGLRAPLLVAVDQEGGPVRRIPGAPARAAADVRSPSAARADGRAAARTLRGAGANLDLAPVADVAPRPAALWNASGAPTGARPHGSRALRRVRRRPARGRRARDRQALPRLRRRDGEHRRRARADRAPRSPPCVASTRFRSRRSSRAASTPSCSRPPSTRRVDALPAAFSSRWVTAELRTRLRFRGITITDDLAPPPCRLRLIARRALRAVHAGVDLPLFSSTTATAPAPPRPARRRPSRRPGPRGADVHRPSACWHCARSSRAELIGARKPIDADGCSGAGARQLGQQASRVLRTVGIPDWLVDPPGVLENGRRCV